MKIRLSLTLLASLARGSLPRKSVRDALGEMAGKYDGTHVADRMKREAERF